MSLHNSPLLLSQEVLQNYPCKNWLALAKDAGHFFDLARTLSHIPTSWIAWAEKIFEKRLRGSRKRKIEFPLTYRMNILWNGIVLQQETKFLCDLMENALRLGILKHSHRWGVAFVDIERTIPAKRLTDLIKAIEKQSGTEVVRSNVIQEIVLLSFTFYETSEIIVRNWSKIQRPDQGIAGFGDLFWKDKSCRDQKLFQRDMKTVRDARNKIAHSKALFEVHETRKVYHVVQRWLRPIDKLALDEGIAGFRRHRPDFLNGVSGIKPHLISRRKRTTGRKSSSA